MSSEFQVVFLTPYMLKSGKPDPIINSNKCDHWPFSKDSELLALFQVEARVSAGAKSHRGTVSIVPCHDGETGQSEDEPQT